MDEQEVLWTPRLATYHSKALTNSRRLVLIAIKQLHKPILIHVYIVDLSSIFCTPLLCTMTTVFSYKSLTSLHLPVLKIACISVQ